MECPIVKCHWCFYHILTSSVICYWTDLLYMESFCITQQSEKKKTAYLEPRDYSKICATLGIWKSQTVVFVSASSFTLFHWQTVSSKSFSTSSLAQSRIMAKTFCKTASLSCKKTCHVCDLQLRLERWHSQVVKNSFRLRFSIFLFRKKLQLNVIRGPK